MRFRRTGRTIVGAALGLLASLFVGGAVQALPPPAPNTHLGNVYTTGQLISLPFVLATPKLDYLYSSGFGPPVNIPLRTFTKIGQWSTVYNPLPTLPAWVEPGTSVWSPDVRKVGANYVMWFTAIAEQVPSGDEQTPHPRCLGWATSASPYGPFVSDAIQPALCQWSDFGDIDPRTFMDGNQEYLLWKSDDNAGEAPPTSTFQRTKLWSEKLAPDGTTLEGSPTELLVRNKSWEVPLVEAPDMIKRGGRYYLFFSGSASWFPQGGIGVAFCESPSGPCRDVYKGPWLGSSLLGSGPDEETLFEQNGATWLLYAPQAVYYPNSYPVLGVSRVALQSGRPYVAAFDGIEPNP